jgi:hypothetical protein
MDKDSLTGMRRFLGGLFLVELVAVLDGWL